MAQAHAPLRDLRECGLVSMGRLFKTFCMSLEHRLCYASYDPMLMEKITSKVFTKYRLVVTAICVAETFKRFLFKILDQASFLANFGYTMSGMTSFPRGRKGLAKGTQSYLVKTFP